MEDFAEIYQGRRGGQKHQEIERQEARDDKLSIIERNAKEGANINWRQIETHGRAGHCVGAHPRLLGT